MQVASKRIGAIFAAACVIAALAFGVSYAVAAGDFPDPGPNTLTVHATTSKNEEFKQDLDKTHVQVDVYKIANAEKNPQYVIYDYKSVVDGFELPGAGAKASEWAAKANEAAKIVLQDAGTYRIKENVPADGLSHDVGMDDGLFLIVPHGEGITPSCEAGELKGLEAISDIYAYLFAPSITAAPTKKPETVDGEIKYYDEDGNPVEYDESGNLPPNAYPSINTAENAGEWTRDIEITLKPTRKPAYGSLKIKKKVNDPTASKIDTSFVFHIEGTTPQGETYDNYAQVNYTDGETDVAIVTMIPAGTTVKVTEVNNGGFPTSSVVKDEATIRVDDGQEENIVAEVEFENSRMEPNLPTVSAENKFKYESDGWKSGGKNSSSYNVDHSE